MRWAALWLRPASGHVCVCVRVYNPPLPQALCSLLRRDASINFKAKGNSLVSVLACNLLMAAYEEDENWPETFVKVGRLSGTPGVEWAPVCPQPGLKRRLLSQVYIEDSLGERIWVDSPHCRMFVDNIQTAFGTKMPPKSVLLQGEGARGGGDPGAGESCGAGQGAGCPACPRTQGDPSGASPHMCREQPAPLAG